MKSHTTPGRLKVLVVEDDPAVARMLSLSLRSGGFEPIMARTGAQALDLLNSTPMNAVVLDLWLPDKDGGLVLDVLRARQEANGGPYWVAISAMEPVEAYSRYSIPRDRFLAKPFNPWDLVEMIRRNSWQTGVKT